MSTGTETLRHQNRALVLASIRRLDSTAHSDIAAFSGLASGTVSAITAELVDENVIHRTEHPPAAGRGRPRVHFALTPEAAYLAVIRVSADEIEYSLVDYAGVLKDRFRVARPADDEDIESFDTLLQSGLARLQERSRLEAEQIRIISVSSKGLVDEDSATVLWSPVYGDQHIDLAARLSSTWPASVRLTNETRFTAHAIASRSQQPASGVAPEPHAVLSLGHSIGLGLIIPDGTTGFRSEAPPFGHMNHQPDGPVCRCGSHGCVEAYAGFYGILRTAFGVPDDVTPAKFIPIEQLAKVADDARRGNRQAIFAFRLAGSALGAGLSRLFILRGVMPITVTGRGLRYFDLLEETFLAQFDDNLRCRLTSRPTITFEADEHQLVFDGNVQASLADLDNSVIAPRKLNVTPIGATCASA